MNYERICDLNRIAENSSEFRNEAIKELKLFCKEIRTDFRAGKPVEFDNYHTFYEEKEFDAWLEDDSFLGEFKKIAKDSKK